MIEELLKLIEGKIGRRRQPAVEKHYWGQMCHAIKRAQSGGSPGWPRRAVNDEDISRWALNSALLINGLSYHWMPLSNRTTMSEAKKSKRKRLPRTLHNWMVLSTPNEYTREYISLVEGGWRKP